MVLRKGYGLGAMTMTMTMTAGGFHSPLFTWPGPLASSAPCGWKARYGWGYREEIEALPEGPEREALYAHLVAKQCGNGSALNIAATLEIDAVIDPAQTRA